MDTAGIIDMSMYLSSSKLLMSAGLSITKKAMDQQETAAREMLEMLPADPNLGNIIDVMA